MSIQTDFFVLLEQDLDAFEETLDLDGSDTSLARAFAAFQLRTRAKGKLLPLGDSTAADEAALKLFVENNDRLAVMPDTWSTSVGRVRAVIDEMRFDLQEFFRDPGIDPLLDVFNILDNGDWGPGTNLLASGTDFTSKVGLSVLTFSNEYWLRAFRAYSGVASPTWSAARSFADTMFGAQRVEGGTLGFVPKKVEVSRTIRTEPLIDMYVQKGIGALIERQLRCKYKIDLALQPVLNRELARDGSVDGSFGTIDLSLASDSLSLRMLEFILPRTTFEILKSASSRPCKVPPGGQYIQLNMLSTMGNGYTFPLMTALFASLIRSVYRILGHKPTKTVNWRGNYAVFGDDIIVRHDCYSLTIEVLNALGFIVNEEKSFNEGYFRESCGADWFLGHHVRPVFPRRLQDKHDSDLLFNLLVEWSTLTGIRLPLALSFLYESSTKDPVPMWAPIDGGLRLPFELSKLVGRRGSIGVCADVQSPSFHYWANEPYTKRILSDFPEFNPNAWLIAALKGSLRMINGSTKGGRFAARAPSNRCLRRKRRLGVGPGWDQPNWCEPLGRTELSAISDTLRCIDFGKSM